jgi:hypothetical protein
MHKPPDSLPSKSVSVPVVGDALETLHYIVSEARRLKPEWQDTPQSVLTSIVEDFLEQPDAFDRFVVLRVDDEQKQLLRQIAELKSLKKTVKAGAHEEGGDPPSPLEKPLTRADSATKRPDPPPPWAP